MMLICPYCGNTTEDNAVQCGICGCIFQPQYYQNYYQQYHQQYTQPQQNNQQDASRQYVQYQVQQQYTPQQYQGLQYYQQNSNAYNYTYDNGHTVQTRNKTKSEKKKRPIWAVIISVIALTIGIIWALYDGFKGAELAGGTQTQDKQEVQDEIIAILDSTRVNPSFTPTIGDMVVEVFYSFDIIFEKEQSGSSVYYVTISGEYAPSPNSPYVTLNGSITYKVDLETRKCLVKSDPANITATFISYIVS